MRETRYTASYSVIKVILANPNNQLMQTRLGPNYSRLDQLDSTIIFVQIFYKQWVANNNCNKAHVVQ